MWWSRKRGALAAGVAALAAASWLAWSGRPGRRPVATVPAADSRPEAGPHEDLSTVPLAALVARIDEHPPEGKLCQTPVVFALVGRGPPAIPAVIDLMLAEDWVTRYCAQRVLSRLTGDMHGFVVGRGWPTRDHQEVFRRFWKALGDLDHEAPRADRERAVGHWRKWIAAGMPLPPA